MTANSDCPLASIQSGNAEVRTNAELTAEKSFEKVDVEMPVMRTTLDPGVHLEHFTQKFLS